MKIYNTIIVSDVHLGNKMSRAKELLEFLKSVDFIRLILLGDIFQDLNFSRLKSSHWDLLTYIRKISKDKDVVWLRGNHDMDVHLVMSNMLGIPVLDRLVWKEEDGTTFCFMHGHQFDGLATRWKWSSQLGSKLMLGMQSIFGSSENAKETYKKIDSLERKITNAPEKVRNGALKHAKKNGYDVIVCGHTHNAEQTVSEGIEYLNTGHWLSHNCSYVVIDNDGKAMLKYYTIPEIETEIKTQSIIVE